MVFVRSKVVGSVVSAVLISTVWAPVEPAAADDPVFVGWSAAMPALAFGYNPTSADACVAGKVSCVRATVRDMQERFARLAAECDHDAVFALAYLRTTEAYLEATLTEGFFRDPTFVNHEDVAFARMYTEAYDDWEAGRVELVPPAWRVALEASDRRRVSGSGSLLLGMNAHVNRDLPFVLAATGLVGPDGVSRKRDHDKINVMLNHVVQPLVAEEAARFDPAIATISTPFGIGYTGLLQLLVAWREARVAPRGAVGRGTRRRRQGPGGPGDRDLRRSAGPGDRRPGRLPSAADHDCEPRQILRPAREPLACARAGKTGVGIRRARRATQAARGGTPAIDDAVRCR